MKYLLDERDRGLRNDLISSGAVSSTELANMAHPRFEPGTSIRLAHLLSANIDSINIKSWLFYAIRKFNIPHVPKLQDLFNDTFLDNLGYEDLLKCGEAMVYPLGLSNDEVLVGVVNPADEIDPKILEKIESLSPIRRIRRLLISFEDITELGRRLNKKL